MNLPSRLLRRSLLLLLAGTFFHTFLSGDPAGVSAFGADSKAETPRPNVILIVIDDLGWADLSCYGSKLHRTPHLDQLASAGTRFTQAYAACPVCSPTRAAIQTGKWPARLHLTDWLPGRPDRPDQKLNRPAFRQELPLEEITLAERLHDAGYTTASIGKWHLGGAGFEPTRQGYDANIAGDASGSPLSYFAPYRRGDRAMPGLDEAPEGEYLTDRLNNEAIRFVEQNRDKPFFLYLPHFTVHTPLGAKPETIGHYPPESLFRGQQNNPIYAAMIESLDDGIGRIIEKLRELKIDERTLVIFTSDNGGLATVEGPHTPATSNAPLREGKGYLYEGGIRVPLIVRGPGVRSGQVSSFPACSVDLLPTILEICGVADDHPRDGLSLAPTLRQGEQPARAPLYWHYPHYANQGGRPGGAIRSGDYKLIEFYENGRRELFNVATDPGENRNLAEQEPDRVAQMAGDLAAWRTAVNAQMPTPNPNYHPNPQGEDGRVVLPARNAEVHGVMLRYEPMPHKNTLGFWVRAEDWAEWQFEIKQPGTFAVEVMQGCGNGSGGAEVEWAVGEQKLMMTVQETGGFQNFVPRRIGSIRIDEPGRYTLTVKPKTKPGGAVMDVRQVTLIPKTRS